MLGLAEQHRRGDLVDVQDWQENGGECEDIVVSNHQFNLIMN